MHSRDHENEQGRREYDEPVPYGGLEVVREKLLHLLGTIRMTRSCPALANGDHDPLTCFMGFRGWAFMKLTLTETWEVKIDRALARP